MAFPYARSPADKAIIADGTEVKFAAVCLLSLGIIASIYPLTFWERVRVRA